MRRCIAVLIALSLLFNAFGFYIVFKGMLRLHKQEMKALLKSNKNHEFIEIIKIPVGGESLAGLIFVEPHEFTFKNQMFDIVRKEIKNDTTYYYCINDKKETFLKKQIQQQHNRQASSSSAYFIKLLQLLGNPALQGKDLDFKIFGCGLLQRIFLVPRLLIEFFRPLTPPPK